MRRVSLRLDKDKKKKNKSDKKDTCSSENTHKKSERCIIHQKLTTPECAR